MNMKLVKFLLKTIVVGRVFQKLLIPGTLKYGNSETPPYENMYTYLQNVYIRLTVRENCKIKKLILVLSLHSGLFILFSY